MILGMLIGILIAVGLSLLLIVVRAASPQTAVLGRLPETDTYRDTADHPEAETFNGLLIYRFDAPLFFANAGQLRDDLLNAVSTSDPPIATIVLDLESVYDIDATSAQILNELCDALDEAGVDLWLARVRTEIRDELEVSGLEERIGPDRIFLEVDDAVRAHLSES